MVHFLREIPSKSKRQGTSGKFFFFSLKSKACARGLTHSKNKDISNLVYLNYVYVLDD